MNCDFNIPLFSSSPLAFQSTFLISLFFFQNLTTGLAASFVRTLFCFVFFLFLSFSPFLLNSNKENLAN